MKMKSYRSLLAGTAIAVLLAILGFVFDIQIFKSLWFYGTIVFLALLNNKSSVLRTVFVEDMGVKELAATIVSCILIMLLCILPMGVAPFWNGQIPMHRNQYELLADAMLEGHLYIDYDDIDPALLAMENPYDYDARLENQILYHYDHAFYNGHYYMYFGVVPVVILFIPFKLVFGKTLVTFHATQLFVMLSIVAIFALFYLLAKRFFGKLSFLSYLLLSIAASVISLGYFTQAPALYCTAISSAVCMELWSLLLFSYAVFYAKREASQVTFATLGALCGALAFGCRPPVALANLIAIPLAIHFAKKYEGKHIVRDFIIVAIPYVVVGALLMLYNYVRFESPFEFGQAYQLTTYDQSMYGNFFERFSLSRELSGLYENFLYFDGVKDVFPFINYGGYLVSYPLMWLAVPYILRDEIRSEMKKDRSWLLFIFMAVTVIFVTLLDTHWAPGLCERYRMDAYFVMALLTVFLAGYRVKTAKNVARAEAVIGILSIASVIVAFLYFLVPNDANIADHLPEVAEEIRKVVMFR